MISDIEYKLVVTFFSITLLLGAVRTGEWLVWSYNRSVETAEREWERVASGRDKIVFGSCNPCATDPYETILPLQGVLLLVALGLVIVRTVWSVSTSAGILLVILYGYFDWSRITSANIRGSEFAYQYSYQSYLLLGSRTLDFVVLISTFAILIILVSLVVRFFAERVRARLG